MKIIITTRTEEEIERCDYKDAVEIKIDERRVFSVSDGEPEDSNLGRSFSDVYKIGDLLLIAYNAGKNGEVFELINEESEEI